MFALIPKVCTKRALIALHHCDKGRKEVKGKNITKILSYYYRYYLCRTASVCLSHVLASFSNDKL